MSRQAISPPGHRYFTPNTGDYTEHGENYYDALVKIEANFVELYTLVSGISAAELGFLDGVTAGTVTASKAVVVDASKTLTGMGSITFDDVANFAFSTSFGSRFGTTATQKLGWWGAGPAAQPAVLAAITLTQPTATVFGFTTTAQFNLLIAAVNQLIANQKTVGFMATA